MDSILVQDLLKYAREGNFAKFKKFLNDTEEVTALTFELMHGVLTDTVFNFEREWLVRHCRQCVEDLLTMDLRKACRFFGYRYYTVKQGFRRGIRTSGAINDLCGFITRGELNNALELFRILRNNEIRRSWIEIWFNNINPRMDPSDMRDQCRDALCYGL